MEPHYNNALDQLKTIRGMMERSSRFISLSGWSGIGAGASALVGAYAAHECIEKYYAQQYQQGGRPSDLFFQLEAIAAIVFVVAAFFAIFFTIRKSKQHQIPIWGEVSKRLLWNTLLPMIAGGCFILKQIADNSYNYVAASCLLFYGLGLVNGSKYTLGEVRFLGYWNIFLSILCLTFPRHGLLFWALGFGIGNMVYGIIMLKKSSGSN
jgi:hypothetical protein